jgi:uncharacterized protein (DUF1697 family)
MPRLIAFLRAINVGGHRTVKMNSLRRLFESLGFSGVETFIASGNVVFETNTKDVTTLEKRIGEKLQDALGYEVTTFIRTAAELRAIANYKPFQSSQMGAGAALNIVFLADAIDERLEQRVTTLRTDTDEFRVRGREIYWLRRRTGGRSPYTTVPLEKALGRPFTIRGAKTVERMAAKYASSAVLRGRTA